ncbi:MAG: TonB-dependent receptor [Myxococcota bacterium]
MRLSTSASALSVAAALFCAAAAHADAPPPDDAPTAPAAPASPAPTVAPDAARTVISARRHPELLTRAPASVTIIDADTIDAAGYTSVAEASRLAPNLHFVEFSSRRLSFPFMRGVGSGQGEPGVTTFVDEVPMLSVSATALPLLDVSRIEFVRGPQGAVWGRNTLGGAIHITTRPPGERPTVSAAGTVGTYGLLDVSASGTVPLGERASVRLSGRFEQRDGYSENTVTGHDVDFRRSGFLRLSLAWHPTALWDVDVSAHGELSRDGGFALADLDALEETPHTVSQDFEGRTKRDLAGATLRIRHYAPAVEVSSVTAVGVWAADETADFDFTALDLVRRTTEESQLQLTQELRFASPRGTDKALGHDAYLRWHAGLSAYYANAERGSTNAYSDLSAQLGLVPVAGGDFGGGRFKDLGLGLFAQSELRLGSYVDITVGLRLDAERRTLDSETRYDVGGAPGQAKKDSHHAGFVQLLPSLAVAVHPTPHLTTWLGLARGTRGGGFNVRAPAGFERFGAESSLTVEAGVKLDCADERLLASVSGFATWWSDQQLDLFDAQAGGYTANAGRSRSRGVESELRVRPFPKRDVLEIFGSFGLAAAEFERFADPFAGEVGGNRLALVPRSTLAVGAQAKVPLGRRFSLDARVEALRQGSFFLDSGNTREQEAVVLIDARLGLSHPRFRAEAFVRNAADARYMQVAFQTAPDRFAAENAAPRVFGGRVSVDF